MNTTIPGTPTRKSQVILERDQILFELSSRWDLQLEPLKDGESPSERQEKLAAKGVNVEDQCKICANKCSFVIYYLCLKDKVALRSVLESFERSAFVLQSGWVHKPGADTDLLPRSFGSRRISVTPEQRRLLLECLLCCLEPAFEKAKKQNRSSRGQFSSTPLRDDHSPDPSNPSVRLVNDEPIPLNLGTKGRVKRISDGSSDSHEAFKKPKLPPCEGQSSQTIIKAVDEVPVKVQHIRSEQQPAAQQRPSSLESSNSQTTLARTAPASKNFDLTAPYSEQKPSWRTSGLETVNSSFTSEYSTLSSDANTSFTRPSTQQSYADTSFEKDTPSTPVIGRDSTRYGSPNEWDTVSAGIMGTITNCAIDVELTNTTASGDLLVHKEALRQRLLNVFPRLPMSLGNIPFRHRYEITRVCLCAGVDMNDFVVSPHIANIENYSALWEYLKSHPYLKGKEFPNRTPEDVWAASVGTFHSEFNGVVLSAKLYFRESEEGPLFDFKLQPLKMETSCRLGRRFGNDRFIEISLPGFSGDKLPKLLRESGAVGHKFIIEWLVHGVHEFLGATWKPFYVKNASKKARTDIFATELDNTTRFCVVAFATDGIGFRTRKSMPLRGEDPRQHTKMAINAMIDWLVPLEKNKEQSFLKLFQRIALGLSKTYETVELKYSEIIAKKDLLSPAQTEVMNDGCGQISPKMAMEVAQCLRLTYVPSGFQARIGGAKGFWIVNARSSSNQRRIEVYPSQTKWQRDPNISDEKDHRTFEVLSWVKPLKSAALNFQFLPILEDRGKSKQSMRDVISRLLENGLTYEIAQQRSAMDSPQSFRVWANNLSSGFEDRLKHGHVPYEAGLPISLEEKLNMLLDAGFNPKILRFLKDLAWKAYSGKCELLKRKMNITVGLSTYAYIAVDFTGTLEPDEVYLCFSSNFNDELSGYSEVLLDAIDVLVARSPAHYVSDIQKARAVWKRELKSLKDVIIFSSKGDCPLAKKLSGGDYDGDIAWICWEPTLVEQFCNADQPECPNLEKLGHITKDKTSYADLMTKSPSDTTSIFLERSFDFNLQQNFLGICTFFKESLCYTMNDVRNHHAVFLSTLLSYLVDQNKQGYNFTNEDWKKIKDTVIKIRPWKPAYKSEKFEGSAPVHIIDYLKFVVADRTIETTLTDFHESLQAAQYWDQDVVQFARWAEGQAKASPDWKVLLTKLKQDVTVVKKHWSENFKDKDVRGTEESKPNFASILYPIYEKWQAISPSPDVNPLLTRVLLPSCLPNKDLSEWALLKASVTFASCTPKYVPNFVWWMCGRQLAVLKGKFRNCSTGGLVALTPEMHAMLKPNATYVKLLRAEEHEPRYWEARAESSIAPGEGVEGSDDDD